MVNVRKLRKLQKWILAEPRRFHMAYWAVGINHRLAQRQKPPCGTVACLAGNACLMEGWKFKPDSEGKNDLYLDKPNADIPDEASRILGLNTAEQMVLFHVDNWPATFYQEYNNAASPAEAAEITAKRIDHFIKTKGAE